jgi:hypothetical protein
MSEDYEHTLKIAAKNMTSQEFECMIFENKMPDIGMVSMLDAETGNTWLILVQKQFDSITRNIIMSN